MSDDLVKRLRECGDGDFYETHEDRAAAADRIEALEAERDVVAAELARLRKHNESLRQALDAKPYPSDLFAAEEELAAERALADQLADALNTANEIIDGEFAGTFEPADEALPAWRARRNPTQEPK